MSFGNRDDADTVRRFGEISAFFPPPDHESPPFPSLYWPGTYPAPNSAPVLLYRSEVWHFTIIWTLILVCSIYVLAGFWAMLSLRDRRFGWAAPLMFALVGGLGALVGGTVAGIALGTIYDVGYFRMSTWVPFCWALTQALISIVNSYSTISTVL
ncbi:hypothetical protein THASP1DRAFT_29723 [Thamnocephalis sphaerospora]|uniref:Integral membrane protein n=1 Tax=Thamnocephalis sphaerospora TaxID=78915 RepID=A0A4P9XQY4_9FUNG|nr:hypothetical protein THASP1DRAFT_29723 [Thamnocephalis sphaerospora]|eukprot:RKP08477.1 hypothetical protein THASP1DRAFT_29723 [Thamnocephalis sphaerospora]